MITHNFILFMKFHVCMLLILKAEDSSGCESRRFTPVGGFLSGFYVFQLNEGKGFLLKNASKRRYLREPAMESKEAHVTVTKDVFGEFVNVKTQKTERALRYTLKSDFLQVQIISYGATITSISVPDRNGKFDDVVLGFDNMKGYQGENNPYFGATVGRYANRIRNASFQLDNEIYTLAKNVPSATLHGGLVGFDKVNWNSYVEHDSVIFTYLSVDGEEGYPGDLLVTVTYRITNGNRLQITYKAVSTKKTVVNLTNHSYFNLAGHHTGTEAVYGHDVTINADKITAWDENAVTTGELKHVGGTPYDLRSPKNLGLAIKGLKENGFDLNYCVNNYNLNDTTNRMLFVARALEPKSGRYLEIHSNQPGVQLYTSNYVKNITGKGSAHYNEHSAFCFETQAFPNSVNIESFPTTVLKPGCEYFHETWMTFGVECQ